MYEPVNALSYASAFAEALPGGVLLNTKLGDKFNSMVIGWGHVGVLWGLPTVTVYVRESRYTKELLNHTGVFTVSVPFGAPAPANIMRVCGSRSGRDVDKAALFTLGEPQQIGVPGVKELPLTFECRVLYRQAQSPADIAPQVLSRFYARGTDAHDFHTAYVGEIVSAYILK